MADENKCAHEICKCGTDGDSDYCGDHCREAVDEDIIEISCDCGHPACG